MSTVEAQENHVSETPSKSNNKVKALIIGGVIILGATGLIAAWKADVFSGKEKKGKPEEEKRITVHTDTNAPKTDTKVVNIENKNANSDGKKENSELDKGNKPESEQGGDKDGSEQENEEDGVVNVVAATEEDVEQLLLDFAKKKRNSFISNINEFIPCLNKAIVKNAENMEMMKGLQNFTESKPYGLWLSFQGLSKVLQLRITLGIKEPFDFDNLSIPVLSASSVQALSHKSEYVPLFDALITYITYIKDTNACMMPINKDNISKMDQAVNRFFIEENKKIYPTYLTDYAAFLNTSQANLAREKPELAQKFLEDHSVDPSILFHLASDLSEESMQLILDVWLYYKLIFTSLLQKLDLSDAKYDAKLISDWGNLTKEYQCLSAKGAYVSHASPNYTEPACTQDGKWIFVNSDSLENVVISDALKQECQSDLEAYCMANRGASIEKLGDGFKTKIGVIRTRWNDMESSVVKSFAADKLKKKDD